MRITLGFIQMVCVVNDNKDTPPIRALVLARKPRRAKMAGNSFFSPFISGNVSVIYVSGFSPAAWKVHSDLRMWVAEVISRVDSVFILLPISSNVNVAFSHVLFARVFQDDIFQRHAQNLPDIVSCPRHFLANLFRLCFR